MSIGGMVKIGKAKVYGSLGSNNDKNGSFGGDIGIMGKKNDYQAGFTGTAKKPSIGVYAGKNVEGDKPQMVSASTGKVSEYPAYKATDINHGNLAKAIQNNPTAQRAAVNVQSAIDKVHKVVMAARSHKSKGK